MGHIFPEMLPHIILPLFPSSQTPVSSFSWLCVNGSLVQLLQGFSPRPWKWESLYLFYLAPLRELILGICHHAWRRDGREVVLNVTYMSCITPGIEWGERSLDWSCATRGIWTHLECTLSQQSLPPTDSTSVLSPLMGLIQGSIPYSQTPAGYCHLGHLPAPEVNTELKAVYLSTVIFNLYILNFFSRHYTSFLQVNRINFKSWYFVGFVKKKTFFA